ncbi:hypothetical protein Tco_0643703 [Tanacetum coccineum]
MKTPMSSDTKLTKDEECESVDSTKYRGMIGDNVDRWRLDELAYGVPSDICRIRHEEEIDVLEYQVLTREIEPTLKPLEEIIRENVFCLGGLGVRSTTAAGLAGGSIATRTIIVPEVIDDCMSPQHTDSSEDETDPNLQVID